MATDWDNTAGPWTLFGGDDSGSDLASGMRRAMGDPDALKVVQGCLFTGSLAGGLQAAVAAAAAADVAVLAIGEPREYSGEAQSRTVIGIPDVQLGLLAAVAATGTPVVAVLSNGRALALDEGFSRLPAILVSWYLGSASGDALADILFGKQGPSGRLPVSFPRESGQTPYYYAHKSSGRPDPQPAALEAFKTHYRSAPNNARFAFGHGLTYGRIEYSGLDLGDGQLVKDGRLEITARIHNRGSRDAEEVVQLYVHDRAASVTRPVRELKDFRKVTVAAGASVAVNFSLRREDLLFVGQDLKPTVEPGQFDLWVAPSAEADGLTGSFVLLG
jgi:beta-glucosidase